MKQLLWICFGCLLVLYSVGYFRGFDDTDDGENRNRSDLSLYIDHGTGCQYISGGMFGGIMPRLDGSGNHVGCEVGQ